jgi:hypothetical protein
LAETAGAGFDPPIGAVFDPLPPTDELVAGLVFETSAVGLHADSAEINRAHFPKRHKVFVI